MKAVLLAGGRGARMGASDVPKPLVEIGGYPLLWHIMHLFDRHGVRDFVVCAGHRGEAITQWFRNYASVRRDQTIDLSSDEITYHSAPHEDWRVTVVHTGEDAGTGGRLQRVRDHLDDEAFFLTYGDGIADIDLSAELAFHRSHGALVTMTTVVPTSPFGAAVVDGDDRVVSFAEKRPMTGQRTNAGFFLVEPAALAEITGPAVMWEEEPLTALVARGEVRAWQHAGFWVAVDTPKDRQRLDEMWRAGDPPWRVW